MTDEEFWSYVAKNLEYRMDVFDESEDADVVDQSLVYVNTSCPVCGEIRACAWDSEGRPLIHAFGPEDVNE